jgi:hypothetical protein
MLITDMRPGETHLLLGNDTKALDVCSLDGRLLETIPARMRWTHATLLVAVGARRRMIEDAGGADFYLGQRFIGSTEV